MLPVTVASSPQGTDLAVGTVPHHTILAPRPTLPRQTIPLHPSFPPPLRRRCIPLPSTLPDGASDPVVHPVLQRGVPPLATRWDMRTRPLSSLRAQTVELHPKGLPLTPSWLQEPATSPPLDSIAIRSEVLGDKPLLVFPASESRAYVTVLDVLDAVYRTMQGLHVSTRDERSGGSDRCVGAPHAHDDRGRLPPGRAGMYRRDQGACGWLWGGLTSCMDEREVWWLTLS